MSKKSRFDGFDVAAMTMFLQRTVIGCKLSNVYDGGNNKGTFLFKLAHNPLTHPSGTTTKAVDDDARSSVMLLIESGVRFHLTSLSGPPGGSSAPPSALAMKLRKHIRNTRLEAIVQLGNLDRVVDLRFGSGPTAHHIILELYGKGNLVLTDAKYTILALLRLHEFESQNKEESGAVKVRVGNVYPVTYTTTITNATSDASLKLSILDMTGDEAHQWALQQLQTDKTSESSITLKALLLRPASGVFHYGPSLLEHCILHTKTLAVQTKLTPSLLSQKLVMPPSSWQTLIDSLRTEGSRILHIFQAQEAKGYILYRAKVDTSSDFTSSLPHSDKILQDFQPQLLLQHQDRPYLEYPTFSEAVDEFFSLLDGQRQAAKVEQAQVMATQKLEKIKLDQDKRLQSLHSEAQLMFQQAKLLELFADDVDKALTVINSALLSGMDWDSLEQLVELEKAQDNPIALLIHKLELAQDQIVLSLPDTMDPLEHVTLVHIPLSIHENAHGNARLLYDQYRTAKEKADKTIEASSKVIKAAEATAQKQLAEAQRSQKILNSMVSAPRKVYWFEKFYWFITTENYLVIAGRDSQQNEVLVKRYLRAGDAYVHADFHGAASCILRAKRQRVLPSSQSKQSHINTVVLPLSEQALREAGNFAICRSAAWASKIITSAWWVHSHQVSKTAPSGEYLTSGSFMIRGKKNYLPATHLEMGVALLFALGDDAGIARHANDRKDLFLRQQEEVSCQINEDARCNLNLSCNDHGSMDDLGLEQEYEEDQYKESKVFENEMINVRVIDIDSESLKETSIAHPENDSDQTNTLHSNISTENHSSGLEVPVVSARKGLSVKDRKLIKKYGSLETAEREMNRTKHLEPFFKSVEKSAPKEVTTNLTLTRGKKSKLRKMAKKYGEQDEEDREFALLLLQGDAKQTKAKERGSRSNIIPPVSSYQKRASEETVALLFTDPTPIIEQLPTIVQETLRNCIAVSDSTEPLKWGNYFDSDVIETLLKLSLPDEQVAVVNRLYQLKQKNRIDNWSSSLIGIIRTFKRFGLSPSDNTVNPANISMDSTNKSSVPVTESDEIADDCLVEDDIINAVDDSSELNQLTGKPNSEDIIMHAIPVCGPYSSLSQYKYRVKLVPGSQKRGKASKQCLEILLANAKLDKRDSELIKMINENEMVQVLCGDVKISVAGINKMSRK